jgi:hypothetical protein
MNGSNTAALPSRNTYDDCLISSCIKKLFKNHIKNKELPGYVICNSVAAIKKDLAQLGTTIELSYDYLLAMEQSLPNAGFRYLIFHKDNAPILFAYFQVYSVASQNFNLKNNKTFIKGIVRLFLDLKKVKVIMSGNALRSDIPCYNYDSSVINETEAIELITSAAEKIASDERATAVVLRDIPVSSQGTKWLAGQGYYAPMTDNAMTLSIDQSWGGLNGYVSALTRKYKTRANKILALRDKLTIEKLSENMVAVSQRQMNRLYKNVVERQSFALTQLADEHFTKLKSLYKDGFEVYGFYIGKKLVAFYSAFVTADAYEVYYVGVDYQLNDEYQLYFNMLFSVLERAVLLEKKELKLGRTSFDSKASLGAKPVEIKYFFKTMNVPTVAINWFVNYFSAMEDGKWKLRNPLK